MGLDMGLLARGALVLILWAVPARGADVSLHRDAAVYHLIGGFETRASSSVAWSVLTDYDGVGRFVSSVPESRVIRRDSDSVLIEQEASGSLLFFSRRVRLRLLVHEAPPSLISFEQTGSSPFLLYEGSWTITPEAAGCRVDYELAIDPGDFAGPAFIARTALMKNVSRQLDQVRDETERRAVAVLLHKT